MNKFEIKFQRTSTLGFVYLAKRTPLDNRLEWAGFSNSSKIENVDPQFFINAEFEDRAAAFLSSEPARNLISEIVELNRFRSLEFRDHSLRIQTGAKFDQVEPLFTNLVNCLEFTDTRREIEESNRKRFDLYSPPNGPLSAMGAFFLSLIFLVTSLWLSASLVKPEVAIARLILLNVPLLLLTAFALRKMIWGLRLPARAFQVHGVSTFILLTICLTSFEIFANSALDGSTPTELLVPITAKIESTKIESESPVKGRKLISEVSEYQYSRIEIGHSHEILDIHRGLFLQPWFSRQRLEY